MHLRTYLSVFRVRNIENNIYTYLVKEHGHHMLSNRNDCSIYSYLFSNKNNTMYIYSHTQSSTNWSLQSYTWLALTLIVDGTSKWHCLSCVFSNSHFTLLWIEENIIFSAVRISRFKNRPNCLAVYNDVPTFHQSDTSCKICKANVSSM